MVAAANTIEVVTFDAGSTLIEPRPSVGHVYATVAAEQGWPGLLPEELERRFTVAFQAHGGVVHTAGDWARIVDAVFAQLIPERPSETFFPALYLRFTQPEAWRIYEDVLPALVALKDRGLRLGVLSNWDDRLRPLLGELALAGHFERLVISCEVGCAKPNRGIFDHARQAFGVRPSAILHVGDSHAADVLGARAAGWHAVQVARSVPTLGAGQVRSLRDLTGWIDSWNKRAASKSESG